MSNFSIYIDHPGYPDHEYLNIPFMLSWKRINFIFLIGARGIGKTYGTMKELILNPYILMLLIRRTAAQIELINVPQFSPIAKPAKDLCVEWEMKKIAKNYNAMYLCGDEPRLMAYTAAMSTFSNVRGFDASDVNFIFYDEFQPEWGDRVIKDEGKKFLNLYETVNRNRELQGQPPVKALLASNSNEIRSPILAEFGITDIIAKMQDKGQEVYMNTARGIAIVCPMHSPISDQKSETALYTAVDSEEFKTMALENKYVETINVRSYPLQELKPITQIGELTVYLHKSRGFVYCSTHSSGDCEKYEMTASGIRIFKDNYYWMLPAYLGGNITFENVRSRMLFEKIFFN